MRQVLTTLIISLGLLTFPLTALADSDRSHSHKNSLKKFSAHKHYDQATHERRADRVARRQHKQRIHRQLHKIDRQHRIKQHRIKKHRIKQQRIKKYLHYNGHNYNKWQKRRHFYYSPQRHYHSRHGLKNRHHSHSNDDYLEWLGIMLLLDEVTEDDHH